MTAPFRHAGRHLVYLALLLVALLATTITMAAPASANHGQPGKLLPVHGVYTGEIDRILAPGFPFGLSTFGGRCSVPSNFMGVWSGTGHISHAGRITIEGTDCDRLNLATGEVDFGDGEFTMTAANGDTINGTYFNGHGSIFTGTFPYDWAVDGGTGRFTNVTGHGTNVFQVVDPAATPPRPFVDTVEGVVSYDASDRRR